MYDIIIVGAGPAGMTAALYALRANKRVLLLEAKNYGGRIAAADKVENYPGIKSITGYEYATNLYNQVKDMGAEFIFDAVLKITEDKKVYTKDHEYQAKAIIIATGSDNRKLNIEREVEFIGKGVSYCATCDGNFYKGKIVAVVGGGNTAVEDALYLSDIASKVYLIHRRDEFRDETVDLEELKRKDNVKILINSNVVGLNGEDKLTSIDVNNDEEIINIPVDGLFIAVGSEPKNEMFRNVVDLNERGYIKSSNLHTKIAGIYVAGDTREKNLRQLTTAISDGAIAATEAIKYIKDLGGKNG